MSALYLENIYLHLTCYLFHWYFRIGSKNSDTYKLLSLHLDSLLPATALELSIPMSSQVAAIVALGLLFFNSGDTHLVKILLHEIGRPPGPEMENSGDRESHALAAGFALGMTMIGVRVDNPFLFIYWMFL